MEQQSDTPTQREIREFGGADNVKSELDASTYVIYSELRNEFAKPKGFLRALYAIARRIAVLERQIRLVRQNPPPHR